LQLSRDVWKPPSWDHQEDHRRTTWRLPHRAFMPPQSLSGHLEARYTLLPLHDSIVWTPFVDLWIHDIGRVMKTWVPIMCRLCVCMNWRNANRAHAFTDAYILWIASALYVTSTFNQHHAQNYDMCLELRSVDNWASHDAPLYSYRLSAAYWEVLNLHHTRIRNPDNQRLCNMLGRSSFLTYLARIGERLWNDDNYKGLRTIKGIGNREQRIRISIYQKSCIVEYTISDRLKFLFSVLYSLFLLLCGGPNYFSDASLIAAQFSRSKIVSN